MATLRYRDEHNKVGYLEKPKGSDDYHQVLDFLSSSHIRHALTHNPIIFDSLVKQFWSTATLRSPELGPPAILATIDETPYTITEDSVRSQLQLANDSGIDDLPIAEIYSGMDNFGYVTEGKLTFYKNKFSPQWRFLVHTILHCLSTKSGSWDQFGSPLVVALICIFEWANLMSLSMVKFRPNIGFPLSRAMRLVMIPFTSTVWDVDLWRFLSMPLHKFLLLCRRNGGKTKDQERKVVVSDSDQEEGGEQVVDLDALIGLANAAVTVDSNIPHGGASNNPSASSHIPTDVPTGGDFVLANSTSPSRDPFREKVQLEQEVKMSASQKETRQAEVFSSVKHYSDADWIDIMAQVHANAGLSSEFLGADVNDDNFTERMVALINQRKRAFAEQTAKEKKDKQYTCLNKD
ncbi:hypothetical protein Tco_1384729 [Tanacetum coccineum]